VGKKVFAILAEISGADEPSKSGTNFEFINRATLEGHHVSQTDYFAVKNFAFVIKAHGTFISFMCHHG
jgi:hypothetical protein